MIQTIRGLGLETNDGVIFEVVDCVLGFMERVETTLNAHSAQLEVLTEAEVRP